MATTGPTDTIMRESNLLSSPVAANTKINQGALVVLNAAGFAIPGATAAGLRSLGRAEETIDNTGGALGAKSITTRRGEFRFANAAADPIAQADVFNDCYIVDDNTVAKTNGGGSRSRAGKITGVEAGGVWVEIR